MRAVLAALDVAAQRRRSAALDRRHDLELAEAHMPGIGSAPSGSMAMKDLRDLQPGAAHAAGLHSGSRPPFGQRLEPVERAGHAADRGIGDPRVTGGGVKLGVAEQSCAIIRILLSH